VYLIARSLRESIEKLKLVEFDRHLGALLGGVKGVLFTTVLTVGLISVSPSAAGVIVHSGSRTIAENIIDSVSPLLPKDVHRVIAPYLNLKPMDSLPGGDPAYVETEPRGENDVVDQDPDSFAPRTGRGTPIYEDDVTMGEDDRDPEDETALRRRRTSEERSSDDLDSISDDDVFGIDPSQAFEDERPPRRR
jgi:hypothetical protein